MAEELQYALTRGKQRAQFEMATAALEGQTLSELSQAYQMVSHRVGPSVVHINVTGVGDTAARDEFNRLYRWETLQQGSGVIIDAEGDILTNNHVVRNATSIEVALSDGRKLPAEIVGRDPATDLALLRIQADKLIAAEWGDSDELDVGALVWAVGSPFGLQRSVTFGILSAKNRGSVAGTVYQDFLQTDAAVNQGSSGGPLVDARGRVVGINTAIYGEAYQGISFAIPSSVARRVYERLKVEGRVERGWLGVSLRNMTPEDAAGVQQLATEGAVVVAVVRTGGRPSPAMRAGIRVDDIIVSWNSLPIRDSASLTRAVARTAVGSTVQADILRQGRKLAVEITVERRPQEIDER
jgi:S1-C subfamily serine protease